MGIGLVLNFVGLDPDKSANIFGRGKRHCCSGNFGADCAYERQQKNYGQAGQRQNRFHYSAG